MASPVQQRQHEGPGGATRARGGARRAGLVDQVGVHVLERIEDRVAERSRLAGEMERHAGLLGDGHELSYIGRRELTLLDAPGETTNGITEGLFEESL